MKPVVFDYYRPSTLDDAAGALKSSDAVKVLAGGQSLIPTLNFRLSAPSLVVDINAVEGLDRLNVGPDGVEIGAAVTQSRVEQSSEAAAVVPGLAVALGHVGHLQIRNRGTVCGSLAHADPAAELPALALALGAEIDIHGGSGGRTVAASDFFLGPFWTALADDEIVVAVRFAAAGPGSVTVVEEISRRAGDFAIAGVAGSFVVEGGAIASASLASFGVGGKPERLAAAEAAVVGYRGNGDSSALSAAGETDAGEPLDDLQANAAYRREALGALVVRAAKKALTSRGGTE